MQMSTYTHEYEQKHGQQACRQQMEWVIDGFDGCQRWFKSKYLSHLDYAQIMPGYSQI